MGQLKSRVEEKLQDNDELIVVLEVAPQARYGFFIDVLDQLKLAGARRISITPASL